MKTPDEIIQAVRMCILKESSCLNDCPYFKYLECRDILCADALAYIKRLESQIDHMLDYMHGDCGACKHRNVHGLAGTTCGDCVMEWERPNWEYAGEADEKENNNV